MSGVVMENGQQWERCNICGEYVKFEKLKYIPKSKKYPIGADSCKNYYYKELSKGKEE